MSTAWRAPTMRDALEGGLSAQTAGASTASSAAGPRLSCVCRRTVGADLMLDVRALPVSLRRKGADYLCDACVETLIRTGQVAREDLYRLLGAPSAIVTRMQAVALAHDPIRKTKPVIPLPTP